MLRTELTPNQCRIILVLLAPVTLLLLWALTFVPPPTLLLADILGITAIAIGLAGLLLFYVFLYKYEKNSTVNGHHRMSVLLFHGISVIVLFGIIQWLGRFSPWTTRYWWGSYNLSDVCKVLIIGIIVFGSISFLGSLLNIFWNEYFKRSV